MIIENNYIWLIMANGLPVETHEDKSTAYLIASQWEQGTSSKIQVYRVPLCTKHK